MSTLKEAKAELDLIIEERKTTFPELIKSGQMNRLLARNRYNRLRLVRYALENMTNKEWQAFQKRYLSNKAKQLQGQQQTMNL